MSLDNTGPELVKDQFFGTSAVIYIANPFIQQRGHHCYYTAYTTSPGDTVPAWQRLLPQEEAFCSEDPFAAPDNAQASLEDDDEMAEEAEVETRRKQASTTDITLFLDHIFRPNLFSKLAIYNALQSTLQCHNRPIARVNPNESLESLRITVTRCLSTELRSQMSATEFKNLLYAFHASVTDYHTQGCQPLGLFSLTPKPQTLYEQMQAIQLYTRESLLTRCRALVRNLSNNSVWLSHDRELFHDFDNFSNPKAVLGRLL
ncbi:unnamed protein product [Dibothriocephalus latus]|uniref:Nucleoporin Nup120/160 beta-propeller domain-containing protein n=1 Tax=Dibothriocephalus latus TaxID=60516 RepID=A0A3P7LCQ1_DIBLA|nr:unnamed protein product [Dibothriocephalus latus]